MITNNNEENTQWHYLAVKSLSGLCRGITSNHNGLLQTITETFIV